MKEKLIQQKRDELVKSLIPKQRESLRFIDWLYYGSRGSGRTYVTCVAAMLQVLNGQDGLVLEHTANVETGRSFSKSIIQSLSIQFDIPVKIRDVRNGFIVSPIRADYDKA